jgi:hypothetical protein
MIITYHSKQEVAKIPSTSTISMLSCPLTLGHMPKAKVTSLRLRSRNLLMKAPFVKINSHSPHPLLLVNFWACYNFGHHKFMTSYNINQRTINEILNWNLN